MNIILVTKVRRIFETKVWEYPLIISILHYFREHDDDKLYAIQIRTTRYVVTWLTFKYGKYGVKVVVVELHDFGNWKKLLYFRFCCILIITGVQYKLVVFPDNWDRIFHLNAFTTEKSNCQFLMFRFNDNILNTF